MVGSLIGAAIVALKLGAGEVEHNAALSATPNAQRTTKEGQPRTASLAPEQRPEILRAAAARTPFTPPATGHPAPRTR